MIVVEFIIVSNELVQTLIYHHNVTNGLDFCSELHVVEWISEMPSINNHGLLVLQLLLITSYNGAYQEEYNAASPRT